MAGRLDEFTIVSSRLEGNPLGDPHRRPLWVYVPPGYDETREARYSSIYVLQPFNSHLEMWRNRKAFRKPLPEAVDDVFAKGATAAIVVYVDAWTTYGGSQFIDSRGTGDYHSYLCEEIVPFVDAAYHTSHEPRHRAVTGWSSGGYGAMVSSMLRPDIFGALATHAGDALFDYCFPPLFGQAVRMLRGYDGDIGAWWTEFNQRPAFTQDADHVLLMVLAMAACFSPAVDGTPLLPFDTASGELDPQVWQRWLDLDPVRMVARYADAVRSWHAVWIDAGSRDEMFLDLGAAAFRRELLHVGLAKDRLKFELVSARHDGLEHRFPEALEWLAGRIDPAATS